MPLIKSISGIRGTIGGKPGENLTPVDIVQFTAAYAEWLKKQGVILKVVLGRDGRISGPSVMSLVAETLLASGIDVVNLGLSTTPTVEMAVPHHEAGGGIIVTASHNPAEWNALKLLNHKGEFINAADGKDLMEIASAGHFNFVSVDNAGKMSYDEMALKRHVDAILQHPLVDTTAIRAANFTIVTDAINSSGAIAVPALLTSLGVQQMHVINADITGNFAHNPEPLPEHLSSLREAVLKNNAHVGIAVDPDVDRLCFVCEDGTLFGEEYTLVAVADYVLQHCKGNTVSNMSSTRALKDVTLKNGGSYYASAVGEVNVVNQMKAQNAVIGGEGNGGIIVPELHYGRDALVGIALFLSLLAKSNKSTAELRRTYPDYYMSKNKINLAVGMDVQTIFERVREKYSMQPMNTDDGLKIEFDHSWVHLRTSNTEPIIRIYSESDTADNAEALANTLMQDIKQVSANL